MTTDLRVDLDLDLALRHGPYAARLHARHELRGSTVHATATAGGEVEDRRFGVRLWRSELARACRVTIPDDAPAPPSDGPALPWDLVVGTGAALAARRPDLYDVLVAATDPAQREALRRLHRAVGRLRVVGTLPARTRIGWVTWVLHADGWRALTPYVERGAAGSRAMLRLERRRPEDLALEVARWVAEVPR
jgi:hypothetical protein